MVKGMAYLLRQEFRSALIRVGILSAVLNVLMLGGSFFMLLVYDEVIPSRSVPTLVGLLVMITVVYIFQALLDLVRSRAIFQFGAIIDRRLADQVFHLIVRHDLRRAKSADGMQPVRDLDQIRTFFSGLGPFALLDLPWVVLFLAILYIFHVLLGLLATAGVIILVVLTYFTNKMTKAPSIQSSAAGSARYGIATASRRNAEVIYALGMEKRISAIWNTSSQRALDASDQLARVGGSMSSISKTFRMLLQSLMLATGAALVITDQASGGIIIASSILSSRALAPVEQVIAHWSGFVSSRQAWNRLQLIIEAIGSERDVMPLPAPSKSLSVENLTAVPPGSNKAAISDVTFALKAGQVLGIIGPSGSGKTSLARALTGVWLPARGSVRLDSSALDQWAAEDIGRHIGYVPQDAELFDGTIAQNIARFEENPVASAIIAAATAANAHELVAALPQGYDTRIGQDGSNLSAGQRQRIALARALYGDPFLIVLDEPNSNLDTNGEIALIDAIQKAAARGAIVLVSAHRASVLAATTHILFVSDGRPQLFGPRDQVLERLKIALPGPETQPTPPVTEDQAPPNEAAPSRSVTSNTPSRKVQSV
jgi:PrtD family type I secretion system ABC transporter|tara:strand:+ start:49659 stop:51452 length:1794 start_codon:yes stop_codon:yes gene_type:complete